MNKGVDWDYYDRFESLIGQYMPLRGEGETMASQAVTAINKLVYKWYNDGDVFDNTSVLQGWCNDLSTYANWLWKYMPGMKILSAIRDITTDEEYELLLQQAANSILSESFLSQWADRPKKDSIYDCKGPFKFVEHWVDDEEEEDYWEEDNDEDVD